MSKTKYKDIIQIMMESEPKEDWVRSSDGYQPGASIQFFRNDVNLRFEVIDSSDDEDDIYYANEDFKVDWANKHPDPKAWSYFRMLNSVTHSYLLF